MAQVKPLNQAGDKLNPMPEKYLNRRPRGRENTTSHSSRTERESVKYHAKILGGRQSAARVTDQLNPDRSVSEANKQGRSFPGLVA